MITEERTIRVLVADDHALVRAGLRLTLTAERDIAIVGEATTGNEAQALCEELQPDVLLLDLRMPGLPAAEMVTHARAHWPVMRVVIVTAFDDTLHLRDLVRRGVVGYVLKDEPPAAVVDAVRTVMRGGTWFSPTIAGRLVTAASEHRGKAPGMTEREHELLRLLAAGLNTAQIAAALHLAEQTVNNYLSVLYAKLEVSSRTAAVARARERRLV